MSSILGRVIGKAQQKSSPIYVQCRAPEFSAFNATSRKADIVLSRLLDVCFEQLQCDFKLLPFSLHPVINEILIGFLKNLFEIP